MRAGLFVAAMAVAASAIGESSEEEIRVRDSVAAFYADLNDGAFRHAERYSTLDWTHIDAKGERTRGREAVLAGFRKAAGTRPKGSPVATEETNVRFAATDVAIVTVVDRRGDERCVRTLVVVKQKGRWRITQDQTTPVGR